jgi:hypothetical protein
MTRFGKRAKQKRTTALLENFKEQGIRNCNGDVQTLVFLERLIDVLVGNFRRSCRPSGRGKGAD